MRRSIPFLALALGCAAFPAAAQDDDPGDSLDDIPHITIVGSAHEEVAPDLATIMLGVVTEKSTATAAAEETARKAQAVVDAAKAQGIPESDIQTQDVSLTQTFDDIHDSSGRYTGRRPRGFQAANTIAIRVRDLGKAGTLAQSLIEKGANSFDGIAFSLAHPDVVLARLTGEAVKDARAQAEQAVEAAGVRLGRVLKIERPRGTERAPPVAFAASVRAKASATAAMPIEAGTSDTNTTIEVTWALEGR